MTNPVLAVAAVIVIDVMVALIVAQLVILRVEKRIGDWITAESESALSDWAALDERVSALEGRTPVPLARAMRVADESLGRPE